MVKQKGEGRVKVEERGRVNGGEGNREREGKGKREGRVKPPKNRFKGSKYNYRVRITKSERFFPH